MEKKLVANWKNEKTTKTDKKEFKFLIKSWAKRTEKSFLPTFSRFSRFLERCWNFAGISWDFCKYSHLRRWLKLCRELLMHWMLLMLLIPLIWIVFNFRIRFSCSPAAFPWYSFFFAFCTIYGIETLKCSCRNYKKDVSMNLFPPIFIPFNDVHDYDFCIFFIFNFLLRCQGIGVDF